MVYEACESLLATYSNSIACYGFQLKIQQISISRFDLASVYSINTKSD
jgi:hypothetical protein